MRDYNPTLVKKQFHFVRNMSRSDARQVTLMSHRSNVNLVTVYNPIIKNLQTVIRINLSIYSNPEIKNIFVEGSINFTYKRSKSLRESPSRFPQTQVELSCTSLSLSTKETPTLLLFTPLGLKSFSPLFPLTLCNCSPIKPPG